MEAPSEPGFAHLSRVQLAPGGPGLWGGVKHAQPRAWLVLRHLSSAGPLGGACGVQRGGALCSPLECGLASRLASNQKTMTKVTCVPSTAGYKRWWLPVCQTLLIASGLQASVELAAGGGVSGGRGRGLPIHSVRGTERRPHRRASLAASPPPLEPSDVTVSPGLAWRHRGPLRPGSRKPC